MQAAIAGNSLLAGYSLILAAAICHAYVTIRFRRQRQQKAPDIRTPAEVLRYLQAGAKFENGSAVFAAIVIGILVALNGVHAAVELERRSWLVLLFGTSERMFPGGITGLYWLVQGLRSFLLTRRYGDQIRILWVFRDQLGLDFPGYGFPAKDYQKEFRQGIIAIVVLLVALIIILWLLSRI